jgi:hypothetical protein
MLAELKRASNWTNIVATREDELAQTMMDLGALRDFQLGKRTKMRVHYLDFVLVYGEEICCVERG